MIPIFDQESKDDSEKSDDQDHMCNRHCFNVISNSSNMKDSTDDKIQRSSKTDPVKDLFVSSLLKTVDI